MSDEPATTLLLTLRLRPLVGTDALAVEVGRSGALVGGELERLASSGLVALRRDEWVDGWSLTPAGRRHVESLVRDELAAAGRSGVVLDAYDAFLPLNRELLSICTDWQTVQLGGRLVPNDHTDARRDAAVLARLDVLHREVAGVLGLLEDASPRFGRYRVRLDAAHRHVRSGRTEWLTRPTVASYHSTWFELHEHLLVALGRQRTDEGPPDAAPAGGRIRGADRPDTPEGAPLRTANGDRP
jgi:hypothetical protein